MSASHNKAARSRPDLPVIYEYPEDETIQFTVITTSGVMLCAVMHEDYETALTDLRAGNEPPEPAVTEVCSWDEIDELRWDPADTRLSIMTKELIGFGATEIPLLDKTELRDVVRHIARLKGGASKPVEEPVSIWTAGSTPLMVMVAAVIFYGGPAALALAGSTGGAAPRAGRAGKLQAGVQLFAELGTVGTILVGVALYAGLGTWWYLACQNRAVRKVVRFTPTSESR